jgi:signal transduction histidine kinase
VIPAELETAIYRIVREVIHQFRKHADANCVRVSLGARDGGVNIAIADDGNRFEPSVTEQSTWVW